MHACKQSLLIILLLALAGCGQGISFDEAQPANGKALQHFPSKLHGTYLAADEESVVVITDSMIVREYDYDEVLPKDSTTLTYHISGDTLFSGKGNDTVEALYAKAVGDTFFIHVSYTDTLFSFSADEVLKKYKNYYLLNERYKADSTQSYIWEVNRLWLKKGILGIAPIQSAEELSKLQELTETSDSDTHFKPTPAQFRAFMRTVREEDGEQFMRIKD